MIICQNISKKFYSEKKGVPALSDFSLEIEEGELLILSGPPGSGKTTLLALLAGFLSPNEGSVHILGKELKRFSPEELRLFRQKNMGVCLQNFSLFSSLTVLENVLIPLYLAKMKSKAARPRAFTLLEQVGLYEKRDFPITALSEAEKGVVQLARALALEPKILLLDEPTLLLDHPTSIKIMTFLRELVLDQQVTVIASIGDNRLHPFASRLIRLKKGQILEVSGETVKEMTPLPYLKI